MAQNFIGCDRELFEPHHSTPSFVVTLNEIIHAEVRKLYPGADLPEFNFDFREGVLVMGYPHPPTSADYPLMSPTVHSLPKRSGLRSLPAGTVL